MQRPSKVLAPILLEARAARTPRLSSSVKSLDTRRRQVVMREVKRVTMVVLMGLILSFGAFVPAFGQKNDNRPPKQPEKVKEPDKQPRGNTNSQGNSNRHGRP